MNPNESENKIAQVFTEQGQFSYEVLLSVKGKFLISQGIKEEWAKARGIDPKLINYEFEDNITLLQAKILGVLDFVSDINKDKAYPQQNEFLGTIDDDKQSEYKKTDRK